MGPKLAIEKFGPWAIPEQPLPLNLDKKTKFYLTTYIFHLLTKYSSIHFTIDPFNPKSTHTPQ